MGKRDYYDIFGLTKSASEEDLKKAYKKFAIKLHPDKNHAPQATEAFKKVSKAYSCLTNPEKKRIYDMTGSDPGNGQTAQ
jgi:DnaJ-class molecular chaperone